MPARQVWLFQLGCWVAIGVAALQVVGHLMTAGQLSPHAEVGLVMLGPRYVVTVPGLPQPTYIGVVDALSITVAILFVTMGAAGLGLVRRLDFTPRALRAVAGAYAAGTALALIVSVALAFSLHSFVLAVVPLCFGLAAVPEE